MIKYDEIRIDELEIFAHHGVYDFETENGQKFYVNAILYTDTHKAGVTDELTDSTNYGEVCSYITDFLTQNTYKLLEAAAEQLAEAALDELDSADSWSTFDLFGGGLLVRFPLRLNVFGILHI